jgi:hypothetical protein
MTAPGDATRHQLGAGSLAPTRRAWSHRIHPQRPDGHYNLRWRQCPPQPSSEILRFTGELLAQVHQVGRQHVLDLGHYLPNAD